MLWQKGFFGRVKGVQHTVDTISVSFVRVDGIGELGAVHRDGVVGQPGVQERTFPDAAPGLVCLKSAAVGLGRRRRSCACWPKPKPGPSQLFSRGEWSGARAFACSWLILRGWSAAGGDTLESHDVMQVSHLLNLGAPD